MRLPKLKPGRVPILRPDGSIWIGPFVYGLVSEVIDDTGLMRPLFALLDGTRTVAEICARMHEEHDADEAQVREILDLMLEQAWLIDAGAEIPPGLDAADIARHSRTLQFLTDIDEVPRPNPYELLQTLRGSSVVVLGVGGVGSAAAASLAATGIGRLHLLDFDLVESSNLNRQLLFTEADLGRRKTDVVAERLRALDSRLRITTEHQQISGPEDVAKAIVQADLVLSCADRPLGIESWVNEACFAAGTPWMVSAYSGPLIATATLIPGRTCCYGCLSEPQREQKRARGEPMDQLADPGAHPVIAPSAQIAGNLLALDGIRLLLGMSVHSAGQEIYRNLLDHSHYYEFRGEPLADCPVGCGLMIGAAQP